MITESSESISTDLCRIHVRRAGSGPPVLLWHSLFVDLAFVGIALRPIGRTCSVIAVDGPCHGRSGAVLRHFGFDEVADAAVTVLDRLGLDTGRLGGQRLGWPRRDSGRCPPSRPAAHTGRRRHAGARIDRP